MSKSRTTESLEAQSSLRDASAIVNDYRLAVRSRQVSLQGRQEVMSGKAKFGIFGDGKELPLLAMAAVARPGDFRSGYYRDQTLLFALDALEPEAFFAQLYAHADEEKEPATAGRSMVGHFVTRSLNQDGTWKNQREMFNSAADVSPTASQMPRLVGLAYASRLYRELPDLAKYSQFSHNGDEIVFGTIGNASTAEGMFWESINAIGVLKVPAIVTIFDDEYGISVPNEYQMTKADLTELLSGFQRTSGSDEGFDIYRVRGWDYPALLEVYSQAAETARRDHIPAIVHVVELTQPQGHSTSGSHERYKPPERLAWETEYDGITRFRSWILSTGHADPKTLEEIETEEIARIRAARKTAWQAYQKPLQTERKQVLDYLDQIGTQVPQTAELAKIRKRLAANPQPLRRDIFSAIRQTLSATRNNSSPARQALVDWRQAHTPAIGDRYHSYLYSPNSDSALRVMGVPPTYAPNAPKVYGFEVLNAFFESAFEREPRLIAFGEDVGKLGDVNQGMRGLQEKFGILRVSDTGIRECTILGQAIGLAMRGLRPIAEIQYLDYLLYALQIMSDDLATLLWRTKGGQKAPVIVRTRGHRLEGIWHSGSPMAGVINLVRGMHVLVPRDMTRVAGMYNALLQSEEPALLVEVLNGYRLRERLPQNIAEFTVPLGVPEILRAGEDITLVTYGACCRITLDAAIALAEVGISAEVIDVQTLLPFDLPGIIGESLKDQPDRIH